MSAETGVVPPGAAWPTVYLGGGTPSLLGPAGLRELAAWIDRGFSSETSRVKVAPFLKGGVALNALANVIAITIITGPWNIKDFQDAGIDVSVLAVPSAGGQPSAPFLVVHRLPQREVSAVHEQKNEN